MRILPLPLHLAITVATLVFGVGLAEAAGKIKQSESSYDGPPMHFAIVRSQASGCEPNCPQWISAEGAITSQTPGLFKKILKQAGKARLPVLITSSGGDIDAAIALGEIIRARKLDVGVGWTLFTGCWPNEAVCLIQGQQEGVFRGTPVTWRAYCISACSFVLAGGRRRLAGGATLGLTGFSRTVSTQRIFYQERYRVVNGKKKVVSRNVVKREPAKSYTTSKLDKSTRRKLGTYAGRMGLAKGFLALFSKAPSGSVYFMTSKEALSAGLVTTYDSARSLVDNQLCLATPVAENCVKLVASAE
jgi:hypothetical protein